MENKEAKAYLRYVRIAPRKIQIVCDLIRGKDVGTAMDAGKLVPDDVIIGVITDRLAEPDCANGYILDGVPRTIAQAEALEKAGIKFDDVVSIEISDQEIEERMN